MFTDEAEIYVESGKGGPGKVSFLHEKYREFGGPDGGDGGDGGDVIIRVRSNLRSLHYPRMKRNFKAKNGEVGGKRNKHGSNGEDVVIEVPPGTLVRLQEDDQILCDLDEKNPEFVVAKGGKGGKGNAQFATSVNQAPRKAQPGLPGEGYQLKLELKLIADAGLVGFPNAGKSTLLAALTKAKPKIAPYPFTTLHPNLGVVHLSYYENFIVADIPGLIEGAHEGVGLGIQFLKHIERTKILIFVMDINEHDPKKQYEQLVHELKGYDEHLLEKKQVILANKIDLIDKELQEEFVLDFKKGFPGDIPVFTTSGYTHIGLETLKKKIYQLIQDSSTP